MAKISSQNSLILLAILLIIGTFVKSSFGIQIKNDEETTKYETVVGDPGMQRDGLRVAIESWNQCNEVGVETPGFGSPRAADCFDLFLENEGTKAYDIQHKVTEEDNKLSVGQTIPGQSSKAINNVDLYGALKEAYLASKCQVEDTPNPWHFWMIMLKNGNLDTFASKCPKDGVKVGPFGPDPRFDCFGKGCMGHPTMHHKYTHLVDDDDDSTLRGRFFGTWDINCDYLLTKNIANNNINDNNHINNIKINNNSISYYSVTWEKKVGKGSWVFHHKLRTSKKFPWLMLYLRSDAIKGFSGGYHYDTRGMIKTVNVESPNFKVKFTLNVTKGGGPKTQFYLMDMGSCWKNNGLPCDGDVTSDVTRYSELILNPDVESWCNPGRLDQCPPYHTFPDGTVIHRSNTSMFPYDAYHLYCAPGNALHAETPYHPCDPFSNPQPQEILQVLPHPVWGEYGYPTKKGQGWIGDPKTWLLDVGRMSQNLFFYQDPGTVPIKRKWSSIDLGVEVYRDPDQVIEWTVSDFDIIVPVET